MRIANNITFQSLTLYILEYPRNIDDNITDNYKTKTVPQNGEGMRPRAF